MSRRKGLDATNKRARSSQSCQGACLFPEENMHQNARSGLTIGLLTYKTNSASFEKARHVQVTEHNHHSTHRRQRNSRQPHAVCLAQDLGRGGILPLSAAETGQQRAMFVQSVPREQPAEAQTKHNCVSPRFPPPSFPRYLRFLAMVQQCGSLKLRAEFWGFVVRNTRGGLRCVPPPRLLHVSRYPGYETTAGENEERAT